MKPIKEKTAETGSTDKGTTFEQAEPRRWPWYVLGGVILGGMIVTGFFIFRGNSISPGTIETGTVNFAEVIVTDLIQERNYDGVIGSIQDDPVISLLDGTVTEIPEHRQIISQGETLYEINNEPVILLYGEIPSFRDIVIGEDILTVNNQHQGIITWVTEPGTVLEQGDVLFRVDDRPVVLMYGNQPAFRDIALIANDTGAVSDTTMVMNQLNGTFTWVAEQGTIIEQGETLYTVNGTPVIVLYGDQPAYRNLYNTSSYTPSEASLTAAQANVTFAEQALFEANRNYDPYRNRPYGDLDRAYYGSVWAEAQQAYNIAFARLNLLTGNNAGPLSGDDVLQLEQALIAMGYDQNGTLEADGVFNVVTTHAVLDLQEDFGLQRDGIIDLGEVVFLPGPSQVIIPLSTPGDPAEQLSPVMTVVSSDMPMTGTDVLQLQENLFAMGFDADGALQVNGTFSDSTAQAILDFQTAYGQESDEIVDFGDVVFLPGPAQVLDVHVNPGADAVQDIMSVASGDPAEGPDIFQLEEALVALGYDANGTLDADGIYTLETNQAVVGFQEAVGLEPDGVLDQGEIIFLPGAVRVTDQLVPIGTYVGSGSPVLGISLSEKVVYMALPANDQGVLNLGERVTIEMPDDSEVRASVIYISQTAISGQNEWDPAWFEVRIALEDPSLAEGLDEAPVDIIIVSDSVANVEAIPVTGLVALLEGGYAVEKDVGNGQFQLMAVEVGFFSSNNMIEIVSGDLEPGDRVVIP